MSDKHHYCSTKSKTRSAVRDAMRIHLPLQVVLCVCCFRLMTGCSFQLLDPESVPSGTGGLCVMPVAICQCSNAELPEASAL